MDNRGLTYEQLMAITVPVDESRLYLEAPSYAIVELLSHDTPQEIMGRIREAGLLAGPVRLPQTSDVPYLVVVGRMPYHFN